MATLTSPISALNSTNSTNSQDVDVQQQSVIVALQSQVNTIQSEVGVINSGLQGIANLIRNDSLLEQTRLLEEQKREKLLTERKIRIGEEKEIEQTLDASIQKPIDNLTPKVTSSFNGLAKAFSTLFTGFLAPKILGAIGNSFKLATGSLNAVKSSIGKIFKFIGNIFSSLGGGFKFIIDKIGGLTKKITDIILKLAVSPIKAISDFFKGLGGAAAGTGAARTAVSTGGNFLDDILRGIGGAVRRVGGPLIGGGAMAGLDIASGERPDRAAAGAFGGTLASMGAFALTAPIPIPGTGVAAAALAYKPGEDIFKRGYDAFTTGNFNFNINPSSFFTDVKSKVDMGINSISNFFGFSDNKDNNQPEQNPKPTPSSSPSSPSSSEVQIPPDPVNPISVPVISGSPEQNQQSQANIEPPPKAPPVGATPPPPPDVIMASTVSQDQSRSQGRSRSGPMTDVPLLPSANIDNFYTLYSQTHYNVVM